MKNKYTIGIDLGGTNTKMALVAGGCRIIGRRQFPTKAHKTKNSLIAAISETANSMIAESNLGRRQILGIGIGAPGLVDSARGVVHCLTNIPGWKDINLKSLLQRRVHLSVYVDNDVNLMALAESKFGAAKGAKDVFCVTLGTGVGGGIIIDGKIYRGYTQSAGEIGHIPLSAGGPKCNCGSRGCLEAYIGSNAIVKNVIKKITEGGVSSVLEDITGGRLDEITPRLITEAAKSGDRLSIETWRHAAEILSAGLVVIVNVFNPEIIVVGGGVASAGKFIFKPLREYLRKNALEVAAKKVKIVKAKFGNDAGVLGAAELARSRMKC